MSSLELIIPVREMLSELLRPHEQVECAVLYGSVARGDSESHSDIDLLVVCGSGHKREVYDKLASAFSAHFKRLSLSVYSARELEFLAKAKSLFLLHLSRESVLLLDRTGWLGQLLTGFEPKPSYAEDFRKSLELLTPLQTVVLGTTNQLHRLAYAYSLFRVFGVYLLAEKHIFEFSKARMSEVLENICPDQGDNVMCLSQLRVLNASFFSGSELSPEFLSTLKEMPTIHAAVLALSQLGGTPLSVTEQPFKVAVEEFLTEATSRPFRLGYRLRTWFLLLVYDGLNLYLRKNGNSELTSFNEYRLEGIIKAQFPNAVRDAATQSLEYLRNYPLKYFLLEESKIPVNDACSTLLALSELV